jgi:hypothetical protein
MVMQSLSDILPRARHARASSRRSWAAAALGVAALGLSSAAHAEDAGATLDLQLSAPPPLPEPGAARDAGALLLAGKVGSILPLNGLDPFVAGGLEIGWIFAGTQQRIAALLDLTYTVPHASGSAQEDRLAGGAFGWKIAQKELILQPTFLYRFTDLGPFVPFAGLGPRIYFLETAGEGSAAGVKFQESNERSTKFGLGLPLGAEYALGPGGLLAELLLEWGPLDHRMTGDVSLLGVSLFVGYRARL